MGAFWNGFGKEWKTGMGNVDRKYAVLADRFPFATGAKLQQFGSEAMLKATKQR